MQFIKVDTQSFKLGLNPTEILTYSAIMDRMKSSVKRPEFYDHKSQAFYVIYPCTELAELLNVSEKTIRKAIKTLRSKNLVQTKRQFNGANKIFTPRFVPEDDMDFITPKNTVTEHFTAPKRQNVPTNQKTKPQNIITFETSHTENLENSALENLENAIVGKSRMSHAAVVTVMHYAKNDIEKIRKIIGLIYRSKKAIAEKYDLLNSNVSRFENNSNLIHGLSEKLKHIFSYAPNAKNQFGYIYKSLLTYFESAFGMITDEIVKPENKRKFAENEHHKDLRPQWMKDREKYGHDIVEEVDPEEKKRIIAKIEKLRAEVRQDQAEYQHRNC